VCIDCHMSGWNTGTGKFQELPHNFTKSSAVAWLRVHSSTAICHSEFGKFLPLPEVERDSSAPPRRRYSNLTEEGGGAELPRTNYPSLSTATVCTRSWLRSHTSIIITKINPPNHPTIPTTVLPALFPHQIARARSRLQGTPASDYFSDHQPQFAEWLLLSER
jgi:hypothetical protein